MKNLLFLSLVLISLTASAQVGQTNVSGTWTVPTITASSYLLDSSGRVIGTWSKTYPPGQYSKYSFADSLGADKHFHANHSVVDSFSAHYGQHRQYARPAPVKPTKAIPKK